MSTKKTFTREDIVEAAFRLVRKRGKKKLSAREIAKELKSSTMPIYSSVNSMKELEVEVRQKFTELFLQYATTAWTGDPQIDSSFGYIQFAKNEKQLFRIMFFDDTQYEVVSYKEHKPIVTAILEERLEQPPEFQALNKDQQQRIKEKMEIFIHGMACLINSGRFDGESEEYIINLLREINTLLVQHEKAME
jgi:DNA-binding transcriptional regulator YbjK